MHLRLTRDAALLYLAGGLRATAVSLVGVIVAIDLAARGFSVAGVGLVLGLGIAGSAMGTVLIGLYGDSWGRRRTLICVGILTAGGYLALGSLDSPGLLVVVAAVTMMNGMGRDRGPASALEQALLPATTTDTNRTWTMAGYNATIDTGHAVGALGAVLPTVFSRAWGANSVDAHAATFALCGVALLLSTLPYAFLTSVSDAPADVADREARIGPDTRSVVRRLTLLFGLDSIGGGFLSSALVAYWFFERYGTSEAQLAGLFFVARVLNVVSHIAAAWIAKRIGLVNTMVFTHLPSSVLLMMAPAAPTATLAMALFLAREALVEMDVPTRQSYVMAVVPPSARTYASGMTNVTRNAGWAVGPLVGGSVMQHLTLAAPLLIGGVLKIGYDIALYRSFRHMKPPEEQAITTGALSN